VAFVHGKGTAVSIDDNDMSPYTNNVAFNRSADSHDVTTFGRNSKRYQSGLKDGTATVSGVYDNTAMTGPGAVFRPLVGGAEVELVYEPEGSGTGRPVATVNVIVTAYNETSPVADMVTWEATLQFSGDIADTVGGA